MKGLWSIWPNTNQQPVQVYGIHLFSYFAKFTCPLFEVCFAKLSSPHCYLAKFDYLLSWLYFFAKLWSPCCHIFMASFPHCQLCIKCYLALKPVDYLNTFQAAHQIGNYMMLLPQQSGCMCNFPKIDCSCDRRLILSRTWICETRSNNLVLRCKSKLSLSLNSLQ